MGHLSKDITHPSEHPFTIPHLVEAEHFGRIDPSQWTMHNEMLRTHNSIPAAEPDTMG